MISDGDFVVETRNRFSRSLDGASERLVREVGGVEELAQQLIGRILDHLHLFEDDFLLPFEVFLLKTRVRNEVSQ